LNLSIASMASFVPVVRLGNEKICNLISNGRQWKEFLEFLEIIVESLKHLGFSLIIPGNS